MGVFTLQVYWAIPTLGVGPYNVQFTGGGLGSCLKFKDPTDGVFKSSVAFPTSDVDGFIEVECDDTCAPGEVVLTVSDSSTPACVRVTTLPITCGSQSGPCNIGVAVLVDCGDILASGSGPLQVSANGGVAPYSYEVTINGQPGQVGDLVGEGDIVVVTATDAEGCSGSVTKTITCSQELLNCGATIVEENNPPGGQVSWLFDASTLVAGEFYIDGWNQQVPDRMQIWAPAFGVPGAQLILDTPWIGSGCGLPIYSAATPCDKGYVEYDSSGTVVVGPNAAVPGNHFFSGTMPASGSWRAYVNWDPSYGDTFEIIGFNNPVYGTNWSFYIGCPGEEPVNCNGSVQLKCEVEGGITRFYLENTGIDIPTLFHIPQNGSTYIEDGPPVGLIGPKIPVTTGPIYLKAEICSGEDQIIREFKISPADGYAEVQSCQCFKLEVLNGNMGSQNPPVITEFVTGCENPCDFSISGLQLAAFDCGEDGCLSNFSKVIIDNAIPQGGTYNPGDLISVSIDGVVIASSVDLPSVLPLDLGCFDDTAHTIAFVHDSSGCSWSYEFTILCDPCVCTYTMKARNPDDQTNTVKVENVVDDTNQLMSVEFYIEKDCNGVVEEIASAIRTGNINSTNRIDTDGQSGVTDWVNGGYIDNITVSTSVSGTPSTTIDLSAIIYAGDFSVFAAAIQAAIEAHLDGLGATYDLSVLAMPSEGVSISFRNKHNPVDWAGLASGVDTATYYPDPGGSSFVGNAGTGSLGSPNKRNIVSTSSLFDYGSFVPPCNDIGLLVGTWSYNDFVASHDWNIFNLNNPVAITTLEDDTSGVPQSTDCPCP